MVLLDSFGKVWEVVVVVLVVLSIFISHMFGWFFLTLLDMVNMTLSITVTVMIRSNMNEVMPIPVRTFLLLLDELG